MKLKVFIGTTLSAALAMSSLPALAQTEPPSDGTQPPSAPPAEPPAAPPASGPAPAEEPRKNAPPPPASEPPAPPPAESAAQGKADTEVVSSDDDMSDTGTIKVGETLSPLVITAGLGYAYASVVHPELASHSLSGTFLEVGAGTELERRFRLSISFTSFETKVHRTSSGKWEEGAFQPPIAKSGVRSMADPVEPGATHSGGVEVQKTFHAHSIGPRMDFLPLGSQGPYLGMTAGVAVIQDVATRVGADLAARVGGEWRPFHSLGLAIEAGAHGQIYEDSKAAIPYAMARMSLMLEPPGMQNKATMSSPSNNMVMPRTLPPPTPR